MSVTTRPWRRLIHRSVALAVVAVALQAAPAAAAPPSPVITGPVGTTSPAVELTWEPVEGATGYEVKVDNDPGFGSAEWSTGTVNNVSVPTRLFAVGQQHVQVRAKDASNTWSEWALSTFTVEAGSGPTLTSPDDGATLAQPADPPVLVWTPVGGAATYTVELDTEPGFVGPTTYATEATALVVPDNQAPDVVYYWRVRANLVDGVATDFSSPRSYEVAPIALPVITAPANDLDITDVVLDWDPVPGSQYYELQVDDDFDFSSPETGAAPLKVMGSRFSPATTFGNDQYYWRVRAVDLDNNPTQWVQLEPDVHYAFDRVWRDTPQLVHPYAASGAVQFVGDDLYYEWEPVPHASHYEVWLSTDPNFTVYSACAIAGTTYTPGELGDECMPGSEGTVYYWKVRPMDLPYAGGVEGIFSATQRFVYDDAAAFSISAPAFGATVQVPTLDWAPVPGTEEYEVVLFDKDSEVKQARTHSTSYTPLGVQLKAADNPYTWTLRALDEDGRSTTITQRSFNFSEDPLDTSSPLQPIAAPATYDAPNLRWGAVDGADHYRMEIGDTITGNLFGASYAPILNQKLHHPAATDTSVRFLAEGNYFWRVTAYDADNAQLGWPGPWGTFEVKPLGTVTGQRLALTGSSLDADVACTETLLDGDTHLCEAVPSTPVLDWDNVPYAAHYRVHISRDGDFTTGSLDSSPPRTVNTRWAPTFDYPKSALEDSQAQTPYYWFIQPCKSATQCGPDPRSTINVAHHAFKKISPKVELLSPVQGAVADTTEINFTWADYFDTNIATTYAATGEPSYQSATKYQFQIDDQPTFASPVESPMLDQPTYTSASKLYPEGPLYWRVQPIDVDGNALGWSQVRTVTKTSPSPTLLSPLATPQDPGIPVVNGAAPFRWEAQPFASKYEIQVAANGDRNFSPANVKVFKSSKRPAFVTGNGVATLQASSEPYVWRVRRVDAVGNLGPWSPVGEFKVTLDQPTLLAPDADAVVGPRRVVLRWSPVTEATKYKVEYRKVGAASPTTATTPATAFAPTTALTVGSTYEWRVGSLDVDNRVTMPETWRRFTVGGIPTATVKAAIDGSGVFQTTLTAVPPTWSVPGVTNTYAWQRDGAPISGATAATHVVTAADVGRSITVVVTGTTAEFGSGTSTSDAVVGKPGVGPVALTSPQISGTGVVGSILTSTDPTWDPAETQTSRQWLRDGTAISGATGSTYTIVAADLNAAITLRATGSLPGRTPTVSLSNAIGAGQGPAPAATSSPSITGTPKVGLRVTAVAPTWSLTGVQETRQWLRNGVAIPGETATTYLVRTADVGAAITVAYTGRIPGRADGLVTSAAVTGLAADGTVAPAPIPAPTATTSPTPTPSPSSTKVASKVTLKLAKSVRAGARASAKVKVTATGVSSPTGTVKIKVGKKMVAKVTLKAGSGGIAKVRLPKLAKGRYKILVVYSGSTTVAGSKSTARILAVLP